MISNIRQLVVLLWMFTLAVTLPQVESIGVLIYMGIISIAMFVLVFAGHVEDHDEV